MLPVVNTVPEMPWTTIAVESSCVWSHRAMFPAPTKVTGANPVVTVTAEVPVFPSLVAVIAAEPPPTPLTKPLVDTVATAVLPLAHVTGRPLRGLPFASSGVAVSCTLAPVATVAEAGLTATEATGTGFTVTAELPLFPSLVAVIVAEPTATPVTSPLVETVATAEALVVHVTVRPPSGLPLASSGVAVSCTVVPTCTLAGAGLTVTEATGTGTVIAELPVFPSLVAVIVTEPAATAVTRPLLDTVATAVLPLTHVTARPVSGFPFASSGVALSC